jgi:ATP-binding cassette subfamily B protein
MYQRGMAGFARFHEIITTPEEITDAENAVACEAIKGEIVFDNVTFGYLDGQKVLKNINLRIAPGEKVAFVGTTGAGKTTIANLLLRFYEPEQGRILLDGIDINKYQQQSLRKQIGLVQQDVFLFSDSVSFNIAYGKWDAEEAEIVEAAKNAAADEFIGRLQHGYATEIGERGVKLSGGQKQRIAIARVFLKNPPVLILDEATSALDTRTEKQIQGALDKLSQNRTTLIIAHRLSTIMNADRIVVLNNGEIAEMGKHEELLALNGIYKRLHDTSEH